MLQHLKPGMSTHLHLCSGQVFSINRKTRRIGECMSRNIDSLGRKSRGGRRALGHMYIFIYIVYSMS